MTIDIRRFYSFTLQGARYLNTVTSQTNMQKLETKKSQINTEDKPDKVLCQITLIVGSLSYDICLLFSDESAVKNQTSLPR